MFLYVICNDVLDNLVYLGVSYWPFTSGNQKAKDVLWSFLADWKLAIE